MRMRHDAAGTRQTGTDAGFTIAELMISVAILLMIIGTTSQALQKMSSMSRTTWNRTEMHSGVRVATELLQQEVGQAGLVALPGPITMTGAAAVGTQTVAVSTTAGLFVGEKLVADTGPNGETITLTAVNAAGNQITATFVFAHAAGAKLQAAGGFSSGVVPASMANGSTGSVLKLYGDLNDNGGMQYVEYTCDTASHNLYRNVMAWNAAAKPALDSTLILLGNIVANPGGAPCFTYQTQVVGANTYVTDVAITLTVQTQLVDPVTKQYQLETKTLLNVSPRNVFNVWEMASIGLTDRVQPMPASVQALLH
jgi:hypothetical protein